MPVPGIEDEAGGIATPGPEGTMLEVVVAGPESYCARASRGKRARTVTEASMVFLSCFWVVVKMVMVRWKEGRAFATPHKDKKAVTVQARNVFAEGFRDRTGSNTRALWSRG